MTAAVDPALERNVAEVRREDNRHAPCVFSAMLPTVLRNNINATSNPCVCVVCLSVLLSVVVFRLGLTESTNFLIYLSVANRYSSKYHGRLPSCAATAEYTSLRSYCEGDWLAPRMSQSPGLMDHC